MKGYGQFCPVAKAAEVVGERWTPLIIRELTCGPASFNELRKGVPLISPTLLSNRLKSLEHQEVIVRQVDQDRVTYCLSEAGEELGPIIQQLGVWGQRWARSDMKKEDLDPSLLMWDMHRTIDTQGFDAGRTVLLFEFIDYTSKMRRWWLVVNDQEVDVCLKDPGYEVNLHLVTDLKTMTEIWMGDSSVAKAKRANKLRVSGAAKLKSSIESWLKCSSFAGVKPAKPARA